MSSPFHIYKLLLHCYPAAFREEYGNQMRLMFAEQLSEARQTGNLFKQAGLWMQAAWDALSIAPQEHGHVIMQDLHYAVRSMAARPTFAAVAIVSLALGIGANTAIFSLWNGLLHSSLPAVDKPEELAILSNPGMAGSWHGNVTGNRNWLTYAEFEQLRDQARSFSGLMASQSGLADWQVRFTGGEWEEAHERLVSGGYFRVLGVRPMIGLGFTAEDDRVALPHAVISYSYWQRRFGGSPDVVGKTITIATIPTFSRSAVLPRAALTIIGVMPSRFIGETAGQQPDLWIPLRMQPVIVPSFDWLHEKPPEKIMWLHAFGRLKPGVTPARAEAEVNTIFKSGLESFYGSVTPGPRRRELLDQRLKVQSGARGASEIRVDFSTSLTALFAAVGLLLLISCANLANLQLAHGAARKAEIALRLSLGANRGRIVRQLVTESLLLAALGGITGMAIGYLLYGALVQMIVQVDGNFQLGFGVSASTLVFALAVTVAAAMLFGLLPAWQATKTDAGSSLKDQSRSATSGTGSARWGRSLVSLQIALSLPLLVGAGLLARTLYNLQHADLGYPARHLLLVRVDLHDAVYGNARRSSLLRELLEQFAQIPGVRAASFSGLGVFSGGESTSTIAVEGHVAKGDSDRESALDRIGPHYFSALGVPMILGREILERDGEGAPKVCVINQAFAQRFFARRNPIGLKITSMGLGAEQTVCRVVGVAQNAHTQNLRGEVEPRYFVAQQQDLSSVDMPTFLIRTATETRPVLAAVRQAFRRVDAALPIGSAASIEEQIAPLTVQDRSTARLAVAFGSVALALASIGLYGVLSYGILRRRGEIAIRIAVGARPGRVVAMILRETSGLVAVGLTVGAGLSYASSRLIGSRLFGIAPQDPLTIALAIALLFLVAFGAAYLPARRASRLEPIAALRRE